MKGPARAVTRLSRQSARGRKPERLRALLPDVWALMKPRRGLLALALVLMAVSRVRQTPMITAILGECYGMPTWMACLSDFVVQVKGSAMGVSGPRVVELALGERVTDEELGGWQVHAEITGNVDRVAENEDECFSLIRQYLSYMPSHCDELPPRAPVPEGSGSTMDRILDWLPEKRNRGYDMHRILECIVDAGSLFPLKPSFGKTVIRILLNGEVASVFTVCSCKDSD